MRVTESLMFRNQAAALSAAYGRLFDVQAQLSSGRRLLAPSDDPSAIRPALDVRATRSRLAQVQRNADFASSDLGSADGALQSVSDLITRARELAVEGANGTLSQSERDGIAIEVDGLLQQLVTLANSKGGSGFLFAGGKTAVAPYEQIGGGGVLYRGDEGTTSVDLGDSIRLAANVPGSQIFGIGARGATAYSGTTGAAADGGNDSIHGTARLAVVHTRTVLGDGALGGTGDSASGLQVGAASASGDTLLGLAAGWTIALNDTSGTGASGTVSLNGGPPVSWTSADSDLVVTAPGGELVHLDLSSVTAGFNGNVTAAGEGTFSLDGGATTQAIDFASGSQIVTDSRSGASIFVDARGVARAGTEVLRPSGAYDLFDALVELRDSLKNVDGEAIDAQLDHVQASIGDLERGQDRLLDALATIGSRTRLIDTARARAVDLDTGLATRQSGLEDADYAAGSVELNLATMALQAGVSISARIANLPSLVQLL